MFHIDKGSRSALGLALCYDVLTNGGLTRRFRTVNFGYASLWDAAHAQGHIQGEGARWYCGYLHVRGFSQTHDRTFTIFFDDIK